MFMVTLGNYVLIALKRLKYTHERELEFDGELIRSSVVEIFLLNFTNW